MGENIVEMQYASSTGHTWVLRYRRSDLAGAVDAVFRWFVDVPAFEAKDFGSFLAAILDEAVEQKLITEDGFRMVAKVLKAIPAAGLEYEQQVNLMRIVMLAAVDSTA